MNLQLLRFGVLVPAFGTLERITHRALMTDHRAVVLSMAIALQESGATHRRQVRGPARSLWQFERGGAYGGLWSHPTTAKWVPVLAEELDLPTNKDECWPAMEWNDLFPAAMSRLLLWTHPDPLPAALPSNEDAAWKYYLWLWRPGRPGPDRWSANWQLALRACGDDW